MNPITLMLLTVVANAIVTGVIVYLIQKRIERSYTKQMEEFRANLQYSNFEQLTKFVRSHQKRVDTLETLCHKFSEFATPIISIGRKITGKIWTKQPIPTDELGKQIDKGFEKFYEIYDFLQINRIYLPATLVTEIREILRKSHDIALLALDFGSLSEIPSVSLEFLNQSILTSGLAVKMIDTNKPDDVLFIDEVIIEIEHLSERLESLYKSSAEAQ